MSLGNPDEAFGLKVGDRIRLVEMGPDPVPMTPGETGTVYLLSTTPGLEQICVNWDSGRGLNLVPGVDQWEKIQ